MRRWSRDYDECRGCHSADKPHLALGYCSTCYYQRYERKNPARRNPIGYREGYGDGFQDAIYAVNDILDPQDGSCWVRDGRVYLRFGDKTLKGEKR